MPRTNETAFNVELSNVLRTKHPQLIAQVSTSLGYSQVSQTLESLTEALDHG